MSPKNDWETLRGGGDPAIERWIDTNMKNTHCVVVLVGAETATRPWVYYEIRKAWNEKRGVVGIRIHNLKCPRNGTSAPGENPFYHVQLQDGARLSTYVSLHDPTPHNAYGDIAANLGRWVDDAIRRKRT